MTIKINGKDIKFGFGLYFIGKAQSEKDTDLQGLLKSIKTVSDVIDLMYIDAKTEASPDLKFHFKEVTIQEMKDELKNLNKLFE